MTRRSNLAVLLDLLEQADAFDGDAGTLRRGDGDGADDERRREVVEHVRTNTEAQLTLFLLAFEIQADVTDSAEALREDLLAFAATAQELFGVNLLRAARTNRDQLPARLPDDLLTDGHVERIELSD